MIWELRVRWSGVQEWEDGADGLRPQTALSEPMDVEAEHTGKLAHCCTGEEEVKVAPRRRVRGMKPCFRERLCPANKHILLAGLIALHCGRVRRSAKASFRMHGGREREMRRSSNDGSEAAAYP